MSNRLIPDVGSEPNAGKEGQLLVLGCLRQQAVLGFLSLDKINDWGKGYLVLVGASDLEPGSSACEAGPQSLLF